MINFNTSFEANISFSFGSRQVKEKAGENSKAKSLGAEKDLKKPKKKLFLSDTDKAEIQDAEYTSSKKTEKVYGEVVEPENAKRNAPKYGRAQSSSPMLIDVVA